MKMMQRGVILLMGCLGCAPAGGGATASNSSGAETSEEGTDDVDTQCEAEGGARAGRGRHRGRYRGRHGGGHGEARGMGGQGGGAHGELRERIHGLLDHHEAIVRTVEERPDGIASVTTSEDPEVVALLRQHVREIAAHMEAGGGIRHWDPLFVALGEHADEMSMEIEDIPGGVAVVHRGSTPAAVALIQAHARAVSGFAERGYDEAHEEHAVPPLPE